jgi:membrane dipeptidase
LRKPLLDCAAAARFVNPGTMTLKNSLLIGATLIAMLPAAAFAQPIDPRVQSRIDRILKATPLIDGHNDLAWELRDKYASRVDNLASGADRLEKPLMTDMARLRQGRVGAQFWSVYIPSEVTGDAAVRETIEQIDVVKRLVKAYPGDLALAGTADDIVRIHKSGRVASLIGIEGGHQIGANLAALRLFYELGARYMTLTHFKNNEWADSATDDPKYQGLTDFGRTIVHEMNRLGMLVDLSHVSDDTMRDALKASRAPVIFSHSSARALDDHNRNVPDDILKLTAENGGVVMVNFYPGYVSEVFRKWNAEEAAEEARVKSLYNGRPEQREAALKAWKAANPAPEVTVASVADHVDHVSRTWRATIMSGSAATSTESRRRRSE